MSRWYERAACRGAPLSVFFPDDDDYTAARRVCQACPVRPACLEEAQRRPVNHGMFGGLTPTERRAARRRARRVA